MNMMTCTCTCTYDDMHMHMHMTCACTCTCHGSKRSRPTPTKLLSAQRLPPSSSLTPPHNHLLPKPHTHTPRSLYARCESSPRYRIRYPLLLRQKKIGYFVKKGVKRPAGAAVGGGAPPTESQRWCGESCVVLARPVRRVSFVRLFDSEVGERAVRTDAESEARSA